MVVSHTLDGQKTPASPSDFQIVFCPSLGPLPSLNTRRLISEVAAQYIEARRNRRVRFFSQRFLGVR